ncbi:MULTISPECIES: DUF397 domain-containing protein [unclassified Streptomyces]|uniref:DUF397 domain-containing protein n=1 Tax=unclassified Streptomyces TaxID=2593676 RepID=UPI000DAD78C2|nr:MULTISPECIES: DUF397 domain-containing protein [unclassified Streptomyces]PZT74884.1 DUF397 domain-containing protein [Streptomyces sp. AC1-42T]PZT82132.1 DUF397 domain-containing protein [Streptomyces sp. AC1-42W]
MATETPRWYTSSYSNNGGACVQVATNLVATTGTVPVRDSKNPDGPTLALPADAYAAFVAGAKRGGVGLSPA